MKSMKHAGPSGGASNMQKRLVLHCPQPSVITMIITHYYYCYCYYCHPYYDFYHYFYSYYYYYYSLPEFFLAGGEDADTLAFLDNVFAGRWMSSVGETGLGFGVWGLGFRVVGWGDL